MRGFKIKCFMRLEEISDMSGGGGGSGGGGFGHMDVHVHNKFLFISFYL